MIRWIPVLTCLGLALIARVPAPSAPPDEVAAIAAVVERAYVEGVFRRRDPDLVREGFAPTFVMQVHWDGALSSRTLDQWLERMQLDRVPAERETKATVEVLDVTGSAAVTKVEVHRDGKHAYTDYFGLYKTEATDAGPGGWKIVTKHFHAHGR